MYALHCMTAVLYKCREIDALLGLRLPLTLRLVLQAAMD